MKTSRYPVGPRPWGWRAEAGWWRRHFDGKFGHERNMVTYNNCVVGTSGSTRNEVVEAKDK